MPSVTGHKKIGANKISPIDSSGAEKKTTISVMKYPHPIPFNKNVAISINLKTKPGGWAQPYHNTQI